MSCAIARYVLESPLTKKRNAKTLYLERTTRELKRSNVGCRVSALGGLLWQLLIRRQARNHSVLHDGGTGGDVSRVRESFARV